MNRTTLGLVAALLISVGFITALRGPADGSAAGFAGGCVRVGLVLGALWLALPQLMSFLGRAPKWLLVASAIGMVVCAVKPMLLLVVVPLLGLLWFIGPKLGKKSAAPSQATAVSEKRPRRRSNTH